MKWIKIFKAGTFKDSTGTEHSYTVEDLDNMVTLYNEQPEEAKRQAPHVYGHPKDNSPAHGWVGSLKRQGKFLLASCEQMATDFVDAVNRGEYKFRSASFYPNGLLRHVGWLGAAQPAVPGLGEVSFADDDNAILFDDFMDFETAWSFNRIGEVFQTLRDWLIENGGTELADKTIPQWDIDTLKRQQPTPEPTDPTLYKEQEMELKEQLDKVTADFSEMKAERDELKKKADAQDAQIKAMQGDITKMSHASTRREIENYCDGLVTAGKMLPAERNYFVDDLTAKAIASDSADFAEGESPIDQAKKMLEARSSHKLFQEFAQGDKSGNDAGAADDHSKHFAIDPDGAVLDGQIKKVMAEKNINYSEAFDLVTSEL